MIDRPPQLKFFTIFYQGRKGPNEDSIKYFFLDVFSRNKCKFKNMFFQGPNVNFRYNFQEQGEDFLRGPKDYFRKYFQGPIGF